MLTATQLGAQMRDDDKNHKAKQMAKQLTQKEMEEVCESPVVRKWIKKGKA